MRDVLTDAGYEVDILVEADESDLLAAAEDAVGILPDARTAITERLIEGCPALQVIGRGGIGVDNVDLDAAAEHGVQVVNVPDYGVDEVSTHALALALACLRRVRSYDRAVRDGTWGWEIGQPIHRLAGSTVGLVAFGKIARRHARKLQGFDVNVLAVDPYVADYRMADLGVEKVGFDELLSRADVVSVHAPLTDETEGLFDAAAFERMRS
jgi:D-3-phosphoglycerate dehydrogenase